MTIFEDAEASGPKPPPGGAILATATAITAAHGAAASPGELVIVARTMTGDYRAVSHSRSPLRAAVSVAVAAGNHRLWNDAPADLTVEVSVRSMPEILRAAAEAERMSSAHVGCVRDDTMAAVAVWFARDGLVPSDIERADVLRRLADAASQDLARTEAERAAAPADIVADADEAAPRTFDPNDPTVDATTGLATKDEFDRALDDYESDEATLVVVDLDHFLTVREEHGDDVAQAALREIADRLVTTCRSGDLIARLGPDTFAVLLTDASRSLGLQIAKRLLDEIALPLPLPGGPVTVTATIALAHQIGLVDTEELMESADDAVASGKRSGRGRLVVAT